MSRLRPDAIAAPLRRLRRHTALSRDLIGAMVGTTKLPLKLTLALTLRCDHRCASCGIWARDKGSEMSAAELDRLFASIPRLSWLDLTGGEIAAREDIDAIITSVHRRLPRLLMLHFPTAGWRPERIEAIARAMSVPGGPRVIVTVSVDGPPALHDRLRGVEGAWSRAMETLERLRRLQEVRAYPGFTLQPDNLHAIEATLDALQERHPGLGPSELHVNLMHRSEHYFDNLRSAQAPPAAMAAALRRFARTKGAPHDAVQLIERAYLALLPDYVATGRSPLPCRSGELSAYVAPDGQAYACTIDPRSIGHLKDFDYNLPALWSNPLRTRLHEEIAAGRCVGCWTPCEAYQTLLTSPRAFPWRRLG